MFFYLYTVFLCKLAQSAKIQTMMMNNEWQLHRCLNWVIKVLNNNSKNTNDSLQTGKVCMNLFSQTGKNCVCAYLHDFRISWLNPLKKSALILFQKLRSCESERIFIQLCGKMDSNGRTSELINNGVFNKGWALSLGQIWVWPKPSLFVDLWIAKPNYHI